MMTSGKTPRASRLAPRNLSLSDEAIDWIVRLGAGNATAADRAAFEEWRGRSPAHAAAATEAQAILADVGGTQAGRDHRDISAAMRQPPPAPPGISRRALLAGGIAAGMAVVSVATGLFGPSSALLADYATGVGEREQITLADGSTVWLNSASTLSVDFSADTRRITLHAGEALFNVAKDRTRPFIVTSAKGEARAVGTAYTVRRSGKRSDVAVTEGVVEVRSGAHILRLAAGQRTSWGDGTLGSAQPADGESATAWTRGKLIFNRRPLAEVAAELERYQRGRVVVLGDRLRHLEVTGVFDLNETDALLRTISETTRARVTRLPLLTVIR